MKTTIDKLVRYRLFVFFIIALLIIGVAPPQQANAVIVTWTNGAGGNWNTGSNWSTGSVPGVNDDVVITSSGTYTVTLDVDAIVNSITVGSGTGTQTLAVGTRILTLNSGSLITGNGVLSIGTGEVTGSGSVLNENRITIQGGTFNVDLTNSSLLNVRRTSTFRREFHNATGATVNIGGNGSGNAELRLENGNTANNFGLILLTNFHLFSRTVNLNIQSGTQFENAAGAMIRPLFGSAGGLRHIIIGSTSALINSGVISGPQPLTIVNTNILDNRTGGLVATTSANIFVNNTGGEVINSGLFTTNTGATLHIDEGVFTHNGGNVIGTERFILTDAVMSGATIFTVQAPLQVRSSTVNPPLVNTNRLLVERTVDFNSTVVNATGAVISIRGRSEGDAHMRLNNATNANFGVMELTNVHNFGRDANLRLLNGAQLDNAAGARIHSLTGTAGDLRRIFIDGTSILHNSGLISGHHPLTITNTNILDNRASGLIATTTANILIDNTNGETINSGLFTTNTGATLHIDEGVFTHSGGNVIGTERLILTDAVMNGATTFTVQSPLQVRNSSIHQPLVNTNRLLIENIVNVHGPLINATGAVISIRGISGAQGDLRLNNATNTNFGTIELSNVHAFVSNAKLRLQNGAQLDNMIEAKIVPLFGSAGGFRDIIIGSTSALINHGVISGRHPLTVVNSNIFDNRATGLVATTTANIFVNNTGGETINSGLFTTTTGATLHIDDGVFTHKNGAVIGTERFILTDAIMNGTTTFTVQTPMLIRSSDINLPIVNTNHVLVELIVDVNGPLVNTTGATIHIRGGGAGNADLHLYNATNANFGVIELSNVHNFQRNANLRLQNGALLDNAPRAAIIPLFGRAGGARNILIGSTSALINNGVISGPQPLTIVNPNIFENRVTGLLASTTANIFIANTGGQTINSGLFTTNTGATLHIDEGVFNHNGGAVIGTERFILTDAIMNGTTTFTVQSPMLIRSSDINLPIVNTNHVLVDLIVDVNGPLVNTTGATIHIRGGGSGNADLQLHNATNANFGVIELSNVHNFQRNANLRLQNGALLDNAPGAAIIPLFGRAGGARNILIGSTSALINNGVISGPQPMTIINPNIFENGVDGLVSLTTANIVINNSGGGTATNRGRFSMNSGRTLTIQQGDITFVTGSTLTGDGALSFSGAARTIHGITAPGFSPGSLTINGDYPLSSSSATLDIEISGTTASVEYDQLHVNGHITLAGTLNVTFANGFTPSTGAIFEILTFTSSSGNFDRMNLPDLGPDVFVVPLFSATSLRLLVTDLTPVLVQAHLEGLWNGVTHTITPASVELRSGPTLSASILSQREAAIFDANASALAEFTAVTSGDYWVVLRQGGRLPIASAAPVTITAGMPITVDFTTTANVFNGTAALIPAALGGANYVLMRSGDVSGDKNVLINDALTHAIPNLGQFNPGQVPAATPLVPPPSSGSITPVAVQVQLQGLWNGVAHSATPVIVELRTGASLAASTLFDRQATIVDATGMAAVDFETVTSGDYWIALRHGGSLSVASIAPVAITAGQAVNVDFTSIANVFNGATALTQVNIGGAFYDLVRAGDLNGDGNVLINDILLFLIPNLGQFNPGQVPD